MSTILTYTDTNVNASTHPWEGMGIGSPTSGHSGTALTEAQHETVLDAVCVPIGANACRRFVNYKYLNTRYADDTTPGRRNFNGSGGENDVGIVSGIIPALFAKNFDHIICIYSYPTFDGDPTNSPYNLFDYGLDTVLASTATAGQPLVTVSGSLGSLAAGNKFNVYTISTSNSTTTGETLTVSSIAGNVITCTSNLHNTYSAGAIVCDGLTDAVDIAARICLDFTNAGYKPSKLELQNEPGSGGDGRPQVNVNTIENFIIKVAAKLTAFGIGDIEIINGSPSQADSTGYGATLDAAWNNTSVRPLWQYPGYHCYGHGLDAAYKTHCHGLKIYQTEASQLDASPPPGVGESVGDFVEAAIDAAKLLTDKNNGVTKWFWFNMASNLLDKQNILLAQYPNGGSPISFMQKFYYFKAIHEAMGIGCMHRVISSSVDGNIAGNFNWGLHNPYGHSFSAISSNPDGTFGFACVNLTAPEFASAGATAYLTAQGYTSGTTPSLATMVTRYTTQYGYNDTTYNVTLNCSAQPNTDWDLWRTGPGLSGAHYGVASQDKVYLGRYTSDGSGILTIPDQLYALDLFTAKTVPVVSLPPVGLREDVIRQRVARNAAIRTASVRVRAN